MDYTDDTFIPGGCGSSPSGLSDDDDDKTFVPGGMAAEIEGTTRYRVESEIGRGGIGIVFLATDSRFNRKVALKRIAGDQFGSGSSGPGFSINMLMTEAQAMANLQHPNIVHVYDVGMDGDGMYLVMEYVDGGSLKDRVLGSGPLNPEETARIGLQLCDALSMVHEKGIVHRDIKPGNVLLTKRGMPKLVDFGLVLDTGSNHEMAGALLGTLHYMSPEQRVDSGQVDFRSDLYSLGATLYFAATGNIPDKIVPDYLHESLRSVILKSLQENPLFRFSSALEMKEGFEEVVKMQVAAQAPGGHAAGTFPCYSCSKPVPNGAVYCPECGKDLIEARKGIEKRFNEIISTVEDFVKRDRYANALDELNITRGKAHHPHFTYFSKRLDEKIRWVREEEKKYQKKEIEKEYSETIPAAERLVRNDQYQKAHDLLKTMHRKLRHEDYHVFRKATEETIAWVQAEEKAYHQIEQKLFEKLQMGEQAIAAMELTNAVEIARTVVKEEKRFGILANKAKALIERCEGIYARRRQLAREIEEAARFAESKDFDKAFDLLPSLTYQDTAYAEQREKVDEFKSKLLGEVKRLEDGLRSRLDDAQAALDADLLDDAFAQASDAEAEAVQISYKDIFKIVADRAKDVINACHERVDHHLADAEEKAGQDAFYEAFAFLDGVLKLSSEVYELHREAAAEARKRYRKKELEYHISTASESVSKKNFDEAFRLLNLVSDENSEEYRELKAKATVAMILAKRRRFWRKIRVPLVIVILTIGGLSYGYYHYYLSHPPVSPPRTSVQEAPLPKHSIGTLYVMESINHSNPQLNYVAERKIVSLEGNRMKVSMRNVNSSYVRKLEYDYQWNLISVRGASGEGSDFSPPLKYYDFPLKSGKSWREVSKERNIKTGQLREHTLEAKVGGWENISVSAGKFQAIKVEIKSQLKDLQTGQITYGTDISWYAPEARRSVKSKLTASDTPDGEKALQTIELMRYSIR